jgi:hypothetical protein
MMSMLCNCCVRELLILARTWFAFGLPSKTGCDTMPRPSPTSGEHYACMGPWFTRGHPWVENAYLSRPKASRARSKYKPSLGQPLRTLGHVHLMHIVWTPALLKTPKSTKNDAAAVKSTFTTHNNARAWIPSTDMRRLVKASASGENSASPDLKLSRRE